MTWLSETTSTIVFDPLCKGFGGWRPADAVVGIRQGWAAFENEMACRACGEEMSYAALHAQTYGEAIDVTVLISHTLEALMVGDRAFRRKARPTALFLCGHLLMECHTFVF